MLNDFGDLLQMVSVEILFGYQFRVVCWINFQTSHKALISNLLSAKIAREVQHDNRFLRDLLASREGCSKYSSCQ
ncbi:MAG: hypothetical protein CMJ78_26145 [Planctomycetaceae bacterium]|nr:hypothetical protein [Planctomycetaceae bacterium]